MENHKGKAHKNEILKEVLTDFRNNSQGEIFTVAFAGYAASLKEYHVQINAEGTGYSSDWPRWAFELAKEALLNDKRLWVISNGEPWGRNLIQVLIYGS